MTEPMLVDLLVFTGLMGVLATLGTVTVIFIKRQQFKAQRPGIPLDDIAQQLSALRDTVESTAIEVERIGEAQRLVTRLLSESPRLGDQPRLHGKVNTPH
jgi:hypothetical protein